MLTALFCPQIHNGRVSLGTTAHNVMETLRLEKVVELCLSHFLGTFQPIQRLKNTTLLVKIRRSDKTVWLMQSDLVVKFGVDEGRLHVHLLYC